MGTPQIFRESLSLSREFLSSCRGSTNRRAGDTQTAFLRGCSCETTDGNHLNFQLNLSPPADGRFLPTWLWQAPCKQTLAHPGLQTQFHKNQLGSRCQTSSFHPRDGETRGYFRVERHTPPSTAAGRLLNICKMKRNFFKKGKILERKKGKEKKKKTTPGTQHGCIQQQTPQWNDKLTWNSMDQL